MNSSMICRVWLLRHCGRILSSEQSKFSLKARQLSSVFLQAVVGLREFTAPAQLFALILVLVSTMHAFPSGAALLATFSILVFGEMTLVGLEARSGREVRRQRLRLCGALLGFFSMGVLLILLLNAFPHAPLAVALLPIMLTICCMALILPARSIPSLIRTNLSPVQNYLVFNCLLGYAFWNMNDASWGTKGLTKSNANASMAQSLKTIRTIVLAAWIVANALLIWAAWSFNGAFSGLNVVVEGIWLMDCGQAAYSLLWLVGRRALQR
jgi:hypothetical protein